MEVSNIKGGKSVKSLNIDGINFNNVSKKEGAGEKTKFYIESNHWWNYSTDNENVEFLGQINAIDIDWNQAELDEDTIIESTGDLLRVIKELREASGEADNARLAALEQQVKNIQAKIGSIVTDFVDVDYVINNYVNKEDHQKDINNVKSECHTNINNLKSELENKIEEEKTSIEQELSEISNQLQEIISTHNSDVERLSSECTININNLRKEFKDKIDQALESSLDAINSVSELETSINSLNNSNSLILNDIKNIKNNYATKKEVTTSISEAIDGLVDGASDAMNTFKELEEVITNNKGLIETLNEAITKKATKEELETATADMASQTWVTEQVNDLNIDQYETKENAEATYQPKGEYLTEHQSLENYYTKEEVDFAIKDIDVTEQLEAYETKENAEATYQPKGDYVTIDQLEGYQEKGDYITSNKLEDYVTSEDLDNAIKEIDITEKLDSYATKEWVNEQNFLTEHQSLENYPTKAEVTQQIAEAVTDGEISLEGYATTEYVNTELKKKADAKDYPEYLTFNETRKTIQLNNYDSISGLTTTGTGANLVMLSKWDVADFGSTQVHINLNGPKDQRPTYNDKEDIAFVSDLDNYYNKETIDQKLYEIDTDGGSVDLELYASKEYVSEQLQEYDNKETIEATYQKKGEYVTIDQLEGYQEKGDYITTDQLEGYVESSTLENYPTKSEVTQQITEAVTGGEISLEGYATEEWVKGQNFLTKHQSLADYAKTTEVTEAINNKVTDLNLGQYATVVQLEGYQPKGEYLTEHQSLDNYYTKEEVDSAIENIDVTEQLESYTTKEELSVAIDGLSEVYQPKGEYVTSNTLEGYQEKGDYITSEELDLYATVESLDQYVTSDKLEEYAKVESLDQYVTSDKLEDYATVVQLEGYQPKGEYVTSDKLEEYAKVESLDKYVTSDKLEEYETKENAEATYQEKGNYVESTTLENYPTKSEVTQQILEAVTEGEVSLEGYATEEWVKGQNFLTEHQDISNLATKEEVNTAKTDAIAKVNELAGTNWAEAGQTVMDIIDELKGDNVSESMVTLVDKLKGLESDTVKEYVDEAIESATTDMATTESVTEAINSKVTDLNLEQYVTNESLTEKLQTALTQLNEYNNYVNGCNTVTSLTNIPTTKRLVIAKINDNETLTLGGDIKEGRELHIVIKNTSESEITISININEEEDLVIDGNQIGEINIISDGTDMYVKGITK